MSVKFVELFPLLVALLTTNSDSDAQVITYPVCKTDILVMEFYYINPTEDPYDLFALSRRSTCGKRAGSTKGSGSYADPYMISVDLSKGLTAQSPDCGVFESSPGTFSLKVKAVFSCEGATANDTEHTVSCILDLPVSTTVNSLSANYTCQAPSSILFVYSQFSQSAPFDIYATGKQSTCSLSANQGTGSGVGVDPYVLQIDTEDTANVCGLTLTPPNTYSVTMYVQQIRDVITSSDASYILTCDFDAIANQVISSSTLQATSKISVKKAKQSQPTASLYVVSTSSGAVLSSFAVGDPIRLAARLLAGPATGLRVRRCTASPGPGLTPQLTILDDTGCSTQRQLVPPFIGLTPGSQAMTDSFPAFKFTAGYSVFFQCVADFCYGASDVMCLGTHCKSKTNGRRKRDSGNDTFSDVITAYVTIRSDVSGNVTGFTARPPQRYNSSSKNKTCTVVVASLASVCAMFGLLFLVLVVRLTACKSDKCRSLHGMERQAESANITSQSQQKTI